MIIQNPNKPTPSLKLLLCSAQIIISYNMSKNNFVNLVKSKIPHELENGLFAIFPASLNTGNQTHLVTSSIQG